ncbi:MAG: AMP-binding protein, partial [Planctomycetota bacterium]
MLLHQLFERAAQRWPELLAIDVPPAADRASRTGTTYRELARQAAAIAVDVRPFVTGECVVAVLLPRDSARLYAAQLAVLQCGAAYVCLEAGFPDVHIEHVLRDSAAIVVLTDARFTARIQHLGMPAERVLDVTQLLAAPPPTPLPPAAAPWLPPWSDARSLAYVIYTSGTTGAPKGVLI